MFGQYFYNVNSTFYIWYDEWGDAIKGARAHGDRVGLATFAGRIGLPGPLKILARALDRGRSARGWPAGFRQIVVDLWARLLGDEVRGDLTSCWRSIAIWPRRALIPALARNHLPLVAFVSLYSGSISPSSAFYAPISGTGVARFTLALFLPLLFVASAVRYHH